MWRTSLGERVLRGNEARVFRECLAEFLEEFCSSEDEDFPLGIPVFDAMTRDQKLAMLALVAKGLLREDVPVPTLSAVTEGSVGAVFRYLGDVVGMELDTPEMGEEWRSKILAACRETGAEQLPKRSCTDPEEWDLCIGWLEDRIFWDRDWEGDMSVLDADPGVSKTIRKLAGITDSYFVEIAPEPTAAELKQARTDLRELCGVQP